MNIVAFPENNRLSNARIAGARAAVGALKFPAFLLVWSVGLVLVSGVYLPADALVRQAPIEFHALQQLSGLEDDAAFQLALEQELRGSAVVAGEWQPRSTESVVDTSALTTRKNLQGQAISPPAIEPYLDLKRLEKVPVIAPRMVKTPIAQVPPTTEVAAEADTAEVSSRPSRTVKRPATSRRSLLVKRDARRALAAGEKLTAYRNLMAGLSEAADDSEYLGLLALSALASGFSAEALIVYERLLVMEPDNEQWWAGLAISKERLGLEAVSVYQEALARSAENTKVQQLALMRLQGLG